MTLTESPLEKPETRIDQIIKSFSRLKDEISTPDIQKPEISALLAKLEKKPPEDIKKYKIDIREDFLELNIHFSSINPENKNQKNKIVAIMAPIFDAIDKGSTDPILESFLSDLLPPRSFIQDYYN